MKRINLPLVAGVSLAAISLFFSATGLIQLFAGAGVAIVVMAVVFEVAKVAVAVHLIQHFRWRPVPLLLLVGLLCLSAVSTTGVYSFLGASYNAGRKGAAVGATATASLDAQVKALEHEKAQLYGMVSAIPAAQGTNRRKVLAEVTPRIREIDQRLIPLSDSLATMRTTQTGKESDIGQLKYAAMLLGVSQDRLAQSIITVLAFLLDPLALLLIQASGVKQGILGRREEARTRAERYTAAAQVGEPLESQCPLPPKGWYCTRGAGHQGPCNPQSIDEFMASLRDPEAEADPLAGARAASEAMAITRSAGLSKVIDHARNHPPEQVANEEGLQKKRKQRL